MSGGGSGNDGFRFSGSAFAVHSRQSLSAVSGRHRKRNEADDFSSIARKKTVQNNGLFFCRFSAGAAALSKDADFKLFPILMLNLLAKCRLPDAPKTKKNDKGF